MSIDFVHTGQHYDWEMSERFFRELSIPVPNTNLGVREELDENQVARIVERTGHLLRKSRPDMILVLGDTNSTLATALAASKSRILLGHIEAGCRSFDRSMPEEINRLAITSCADYHFAPTKNTVKNLHRESVDPSRIFLTGHPVVRTISRLRPLIAKSPVAERLGVNAGNFVYATVHRQENSDDPIRLAGILKGLARIPLRVIFPVHPRTKKMIRRYGLQRQLRKGKIVPVEPVGFLESLSLVQKSFAVITDSGGIQQESALLGTPCLSLRKSTEWIETVRRGINFLTDAKEAAILKNFNLASKNYRSIKIRLKGAGSIFGDNSAPKRILNIVTREIESKT